MELFSWERFWKFTLQRKPTVVLINVFHINYGHLVSLILQYGYYYLDSLIFLDGHTQFYVCTDPSNFLASCRLMYHLSDHSIAFLCAVPIQDFLLTQKFIFGFFLPPSSLFFICDDLSETWWAGFPLEIYRNISKYI